MKIQFTKRKPIEFVFPGKPVPKARPRVTRTGHAYTPKKTFDYEKYVRMWAEIYMKENCIEPIEEAVRLTVNAFLPIPKSWSISKKKNAEEGVLKPIGRPDLDNLVKSIQDALNGVAYKDDSQIVESICKKSYSDAPKVEVTVETV